MTNDWADAVVTPAGAYRPFLPFAAWGDAVLPVHDWTELVRQLDTARQGTDEDKRRAVSERALAEAAFDTGAIEGLYETDRGITETIAAAADVLAEAEEQRGADVRRTFAAQLDGYQHLLDAVTEATPVSEMWIRGLHERLTGGQDFYPVRTAVGVQHQPLLHGEYKTQSNSVRLPGGERHDYAPVDDTAAEMHRLVEELRSERFVRAHPVLQATYAHHAFTVVHPFADGNGRVARALASLFFLRAASVPLLVYADQRAEYYAALRDADVGRLQPLVEFVADRGLDLLNRMTLWLRSAGRAGIPEVIAELDASLRSHGGLGYEEVDAAGRRALQRLQDAASAQLDGQLAQPPWRTQLTWQSGRDPARSSGDADFRPLADGVGFRITLAHDELGVDVYADVVIEVARTNRSRYTYRIRDTRRAIPPIRLRLADVYPAVTRATTDILQLWAQGLVSDLLDELRGATARAQAERGFA